MLTEDHRKNVDLFLQMANFKQKPDWVAYLHTRGIRVAPEVYLTEDELKILRAA